MYTICSNSSVQALLNAWDLNQIRRRFLYNTLSVLLSGFLQSLLLVYCQVDPSSDDCQRKETEERNSHDEWFSQVGGEGYLVRNEDTLGVHDRQVFVLESQYWTTSRIKICLVRRKPVSQGWEWWCELNVSSTLGQDDRDLGLVDDGSRDGGHDRHLDDVPPSRSVIGCRVGKGGIPAKGKGIVPSAQYRVARSQFENAVPIGMGAFRRRGSYPEARRGDVSNEVVVVCVTNTSREMES